MAGLEEQATTLANETLSRLAGRLNVIWRKWGSEDYPNDNGVEFRNKLFLFADWMVYLFTQACSDAPEVPNHWIRQNASKFLSLGSEDFMRCIGLSRVHMQAFWWHLHFYQDPRYLANEASVKRKLHAFGRELDWIYTSHDLPVEIVQEAHNLVIEHLEDGEDYLEASKEQLGRYFVRTPLGWSEASSPQGWDHWACGADMSSQSQLIEDPTRTLGFCERVFSQS
jgi:hypothetical protein